jgi:hypothetical protein
MQAGVELAVCSMNRRRPGSALLKLVGAQEASRRPWHFLDPSGSIRYNGTCHHGAMAVWTPV